MDEERIAESFPSTNKDNTEEGPEHSEPFSPTALFVESCPVYMAMGMTYDEYWNGSAERTRAYREMNELRKRQDNHRMWLTGIYMTHAIKATVGNMLSPKSAKKLTYPEEPLPLTMAEKEQQEEREKQKKFIAMKESMLAYAQQHNNKMKEVE